MSAPRGFKCPNGHEALIDTEVNGLPCPECRAPLAHNHMVPGGLLDHTAWPGGYPILWIADVDTHECATLCAECAASERDAGTVQTLTPDIHYEGPPEICDGCGVEIESAYGDPDAPEGAES